MDTSSKTAVDLRGRRRPASLSRRLTSWYGFCSASLLFGVGVFLHHEVRSTFERVVVEIAADELAELERILSATDGANVVEILRSEAEDEWNEGVSFRILAPGGRVLVESPEMAARALSRSIFPPPAEIEVARSSMRLFRSEKGEVFQVLTLFVPSTRPSRHTAEIAIDWSDEARMLADYQRALWATVVPASLLAILIGHAIAVRGLAPIREMERQVRTVGASSLGERIDAAALPPDLHSLAGSFNEMLARLEESFRRLSRFSGDIAHELRTPIGNLRTEMEVMLGRPRSPEEYREVLASALEESERLSRCIDDLLFLARAETPSAAVRRERIDLGAEIDQLKEFYEPAAAERGVRLVATASTDVSAFVDRVLVQRALSNLLDNAIRHTDSGGTISIACRRDGGRVEVDVADTGCGIPAEHVPHVFDRLYRVDSSRTPSTGGAGLGLAIVRSVAELHGGAVHLESEVDRGTRVRLSLPI